MSYQAARRALDWAGGTPKQRHVLLVIGEETDHRTDWAEGPEVSLAQLAKKTGWARSTVAIAIDEMLDMDGVLERQSGVGEPNKYRVVGGTGPAKPDGGSPARSDHQVVRPDQTTEVVRPDRTTSDGGSPKAVRPDQTGVVRSRPSDQPQREPSLEEVDLEESAHARTRAREAPPLRSPEGRASAPESEKERPPPPAWFAQGRAALAAALAHPGSSRAVGDEPFSLKRSVRALLGDDRPWESSPLLHEPPVPAPEPAAPEATSLNGHRPGLVVLAPEPEEPPEGQPTWFGKGRFLPLVLGEAGQ
jgi:hypothetical protein